MADIEYYYIYSEQAKRHLASVAASAHGVYIPGTVYYKGKRYTYTEKLVNPNASRYSDCKVVAKGANLKYEEPRYR